jgi:hypothetical protein
MKKYMPGICLIIISIINFAGGWQSTNTNITTKDNTKLDILNAAKTK